MSTAAQGAGTGPAPAHDVACPFCEATVGFPCRNVVSGRVLRETSHLSRRHASQDARAACKWVWHDGEQFHHCPLRAGHRGFHARNDGTVPTAAELRAIEARP